MAEAHATGRPIRFVRSADGSKEDLARGIADRDAISSSLVCVLTAVEPCWSYALFRDRQHPHLRLLPRKRKCLFIYHYGVHPVFGFLNARAFRRGSRSRFRSASTAGSGWRGQMDTAGLKYLRQDNCFVWLEDRQRAWYYSARSLGEAGGMQAAARGSERLPAFH